MGIRFHDSDMFKAQTRVTTVGPHPFAVALAIILSLCIIAGAAVIFFG